MAILRKRAALDGIALADPTVLDLIADRVRDNIRLLEGALIRVVAFHSLTHRAIDVPLTTEVLDVMYPETPAPGCAASSPHGGSPSIEAIQSAVAARFGITVAHLTSSSRRATINWARQVAMSLAREITGESLPAIGRAFGGRNHATVLNALQRVSDRLAEDAEAVEIVRQLRRQLSGPHDDRRS